MPSETVIRRALTPLVGALFAILYVGGASVEPAPADAQPSQGSTTLALGDESADARVASAQTCTPDATHQTTANEIHAIVAADFVTTLRFIRPPSNATTHHFAGHVAPATACRAPPG